jgi:hypothetical protein
MAEEKRPQTSSPSTPGRDQQTPTDKEGGGKETLEARVRDLEAALVAQRAAMPLSLIPEHGAGYGDEVEETWSLAQQEEARAEEL